MAAAPVEIIQVLLLFDERNSLDYGPALWAALHEVEAFYNMHEKKLEVHRFYIAPFVPSSGFLDSTWRRFFGPADAKNALDLLRQEERVQTPLSSVEAA